MVSLWIVELRRGSELGNEVETMPFTKTESLEEEQLYAERWQVNVGYIFVINLLKQLELGIVE